MSKEIYTSVLIETDNGLSLTELCQAVQADNELIIQMVEFRLLKPQGQSPDDWQFDSECLRRAKTAISFYHDLDINLSGIALALDLIGQVHDLEIELDTLKRLVR